MKRTMKTLLVGAMLMASPAFAATSDGLLTAKTKLSLWTTANVRSTGVHVDTNDGYVTLYGKVPTAEQKALAEKTARGIVDVKGVRNLIQVVPEAQEKAVAKADKDIAEEAKKALKADKSIEKSSITVKSVDKGVVMLGGEAKTFSDHLRAVSIVDRVAGVRRVASDVKGPDAFGADERLSFNERMTTPSAPLPGGTEPAAPAPITRENRENRESSSASDMRTSAMVKLRLWTTAEIPSAEINVDTTNGTVYLFGMVPTEGVKTAAAEAASKVEGVKKVENLIQVVPSSEKKAVEAKDADINRDLKLAFGGRTELKSVSYAVRNGVVRLTGTVNSGWDEVTAVRVARQVPGVRNVENQLKVEEKAGAAVSGTN
jgi:hyperosmotically inducible protein